MRGLKLQEIVQSDSVFIWKAHIRNVIYVYTRIDTGDDARHDLAMARTKLFRSGNSLAVRLPAEIAYPEGTEVEVTRHGEVVTVVPVQGQNLAQLADTLRRLGRPATREPRDPIELPERKWD